MNQLCIHLASTMQNILVLVIEGEHAGVVLSQSFEDVEMAVCGGKVKRRAPLLENKQTRKNTSF